MNIVKPLVAATLSLGLAACAGTFGGSGEQASAESQQNPMDLYSQLDADQDGNISNYEAADNEQLTEDFNSLDSDKDGVLSADEFVEWEEFEESSY